jgi:FkbM family methyltransferase
MPIDISNIYEQDCHKIPPGFNDMHGFKWRKSDAETWNIISKEYKESIEPALKELRDSGILKFGNAVQAGGHCGLYPICLTYFFEVVFTFEPDPTNFYCLVNNCQKRNVVKLNLALGKEHAKIKPHIVSTVNFGMNKVESISEGEKHYIPQVPLDSFGFDDLALIMLDIEGLEYEALQGARDTIKKNEPVIIVENANESLEKYLNNLDYKLWKQLKNLDSVYIHEKCLETVG